MDRDAFISEKAPSEFNEVWEMEQQAQKPEGTLPITPEKERIHRQIRAEVSSFWFGETAHPPCPLTIMPRWTILFNALVTEQVQRVAFREAIKRVYCL